MKRIKMILPKIRLPKIKWPLRLLLYVITIILSLLSLAVVYLDSINTAIADFIYAMAACGVGFSCYYLYQDLTYGIREKVKASIEGNPFTNRMAKDYRYRTIFFTYSSFSANLVFAFSNGIFGIINHSTWFGTLSVYYVVLSIMRFIVIQYERKNIRLEKTQKIKKRELSVYQSCGILFILLTIALGASVIQMVYFDKGHSYPGTLIFAVAAYTFYKTTVAIINLVKAGKTKSPLIMTIKDIGYADAVVSMLSLQTAMFVSFGGDHVEKRMMNSITGGAACLMIFIMGIYMIYSAQRQKGQL